MNKACMKLPSAVWTITFNINEDGSATILNFDNQDNDGYLFSGSLPVLEQLHEDAGGVLQSFTVSGVEYSVRNKANVFTYKLPL
jgi:hypothetical protein